MNTRILIMGLPGSGKTTLAKKVSSELKADWLNADKIRGKYKDWDFSNEGIIRQVKRMKLLADQSKKKIVVADFVCPLKKQMEIFKPHYVVWMDTIKKGRFPSMNKIFKIPKRFDLKVTSKDANLWKIPIIDKFQNYKWNNQAETGQMMGRFQPFHLGHKNIFFEILKKKGQVYIMVKDVYSIGDNPYKFKDINSIIKKELESFKSRFKIIKVPNITNVYHGRTVGYKWTKINLPKEITKISGTKIRSVLRKKGELN
jgi:hypothetical protein